MDAVINGKVTKSVIVKSSVTHNFCSNNVTRRLGLRLHRDVDQMKAINSKALSMVGLARQVPFKLGSWEDHVDLVVVLMDDFDVILSMNFLVEKKVISIYAANSL